MGSKERRDSCNLAVNSQESQHTPQMAAAENTDLVAAFQSPDSFSQRAWYNEITFPLESNTCLMKLTLYHLQTQIDLILILYFFPANMRRYENKHVHH